MRRLLPLTLVVLFALGGSAGAASLPVNQRFVDARGVFSLLTRPGGKGVIDARTRCGRLIGQRVSLRGGQVRSRKGARFRVRGTIRSARSVRVTVTRRTCSASFTLRRSTKPE